jgi:hypothetical protein
VRRREVQRVEVEPLGLDLGAFGDLEAHGDEDVGHPFLDHGERVAGASRRAVPRQGDVDGLLDQHTLVALLLEDGLTGAERLGDLSAGPSHALAGLGPGVGRQRADLSVGQRQRRLVAGVRQAGPLQLVEVLGGGDGGERLVAHPGHLVRVERTDLNRVIRIIRC